MFKIFNFLSRKKSDFKTQPPLSSMKEGEFSDIVKRHDNRLEELRNQRQEILSEKIKNAEMIKTWMSNELDGKTASDAIDIHIQVFKGDCFTDDGPYVTLVVTLPLTFKNEHYRNKEVVTFNIHAKYHSYSVEEIDRLANLISSIKYFYNERRLNAVH